jgi:predicted anti-sigma-YlaC factor YlaD
MSELVTDYMERTTSLRLRLDMWWHLLRCGACRNYFDQMRKTARLLGAGSMAPPSRTTENATLQEARRLLQERP